MKRVRCPKCKGWLQLKQEVIKELSVGYKWTFYWKCVNCGKIIYIKGK